jgi:hypothetical protein
MTAREPEREQRRDRHDGPITEAGSEGSQNHAMSQAHA